MTGIGLKQQKNMVSKIHDFLNDKNILQQGEKKGKCAGFKGDLLFGGVMLELEFVGKGKFSKQIKNAILVLQD